MTDAYYGLNAESAKKGTKRETGPGEAGAFCRLRLPVFRSFVCHGGLKWGRNSFRHLRFWENGDTGILPRRSRNRRTVPRIADSHPGRRRYGRLRGDLSSTLTLLRR